MPVEGPRRRHPADWNRSDVRAAAPGSECFNLIGLAQDDMVRPTAPDPKISLAAFGWTRHLTQRPEVTGSGRPRTCRVKIGKFQVIAKRDEVTTIRA